MRLRKLYLSAAVVLGLTTAVLPAIASSEPLPVEAVNEGAYYHHWSNAQQTVIGGTTVKFSNPGSEVPHGLKFTGGPGTQSCSGIPAAATEPSGATDWHGECTFTTPGTYTFICTVHPTEMKGTITVKNAGEPIVITDEATIEGEHEAKLEGAVNPEGTATTYHFNYGTSTSYGQQTPEESAGAGTVEKAVSVPIVGLSAGTTYHFQLVAKNGSGTTLGSDRTFTTLSPPGPPSATTGVATAVGETDATLKGIVNPDGRPTSYFFEWGTSTGYGSATTETPAGETHIGQLASAILSELTPGTVYHFRLVARNTSAETTLGVDQTLTTASPPPSPPPPPPPPPTTTPVPPTPTPSTPNPLLGAPPSKLGEVAQPGSPLVGGSLKLTVPRHGSSLHGSIEVAQAGGGGRLEVDLLVRSALLSKARGSASKLVSVGRLVRQSASPGKLSFSVSLTGQGKRALAHRHSLPVSVKVTLTPTVGPAATLTRSIALRS